ncbi:MAG: amino acid ABC transporter substrate-binding protein [Alphaproteobacteria bacterium]|nr:amino acid ABC transporter substrate-binding protein [Alphaproteobacteria bacterium]
MKLNWKKVIGWSVAAAVVVGIVGFNMHQQQNTDTSKKNVYVLIPLSGPIAQSGHDYQKALTYAYDNLKNPQIRLVFLDDEFNATKAVTALSQATLNDENPLVVAWGAIISFAAIPAVKNGFVMAGGTVELDDLKKFDNYHRFSVASSATTELATNYLAKENKKIGLLYSYDMYGSNGYKVFSSIMNQKNIPFVAMDFDPNTLSIRDITAKFLLKNPDIDTIFISATATAPFLKLFQELREQGFTGKIVSDMSFAQKFVLDSLGKYAEDVVFVTLEPHLDNPRTTQAKEYRDFALRNGMYPSFSSIEGYDMVNIINKMMEKKIPFTQKSFTDMKEYDGVSGKVLFPSTGNTAYPFILAQVKNGKIIPVTE